MIQTQSQNEEIRQINKVWDKVSNVFWGDVKLNVKRKAMYKVRWQVRYEVIKVENRVKVKVWHEVRRKLFR